MFRFSSPNRLGAGNQHANVKDVEEIVLFDVLDPKISSSSFTFFDRFQVLLFLGFFTFFKNHFMIIIIIILF